MIISSTRSDSSHLMNPTFLMSMPRSRQMARLLKLPLEMSLRCCCRGRSGTLGRAGLHTRSRNLTASSGLVMRTARLRTTRALSPPVVFRLAGPLANRSASQDRADRL